MSCAIIRKTAYVVCSYDLWGLYTNLSQNPNMILGSSIMPKRSHEYLWHWSMPIIIRTRASASRKGHLHSIGSPIFVVQNRDTPPQYLFTCPFHAIRLRRHLKLQINFQPKTLMYCNNWTLQSEWPPSDLKK